ncbi:MAG TPA: transporter substrate-binding domain-containing protein [Azospirillaceae bacterium]|nr:transporter substrate-binding domain-containing protein [Azospirillaceae bacterium]
MLFLTAGLLASAPAAAEAVKLTSLDWPPFSGASLPLQGATTAVVQEVFKASGDAVTVEFLPWQRAVDTALKGQGYAGYFPEYFSKELADGSCNFSKPIGSSPLGFVELKAAPVTWATLSDLKGKAIGTVQGYVNEAEFDRMAAAGELTVDPAPDDATNLRKVAAGHLPLAVIDRNVMEYLLAFDPALKAVRDKLRFNAKVLETKDLLICFRKDAAGAAARDRFDKGLAKVNVGAVMSEALSMMNR